jgi:nucleotide-binding universal stress UspA family protein
LTPEWVHEVLLPIDRDEGRTRAQVESVLELPDTSESVHVRLLHVFDDREAAEQTSVRQTTNGRAAYDQLTDAGIATTTVSGHGDPADEILRVAEENDVDMIVLGGRKRSPLGSLLFGSVSQTVSLRADRPVTITGELVEQEQPKSA